MARFQKGQCTKAAFLTIKLVLGYHFRQSVSKGCYINKQKRKNAKSIFFIHTKVELAQTVN